jgi:pimeloyl-ACP methyl ester carboxylesterase
VLECEDLLEVILVGHSFGGMVVSGVAERVPDRLGRLVYLDAWFPMDEDRSMAELGGRLLPGFLSPLEARVQVDGDGWMVPTPGGPEYPLPLTEAADLHWVFCAPHAPPGLDALRPYRDGRPRCRCPPTHLHHLPDVGCALAPRSLRGARAARWLGVRGTGRGPPCDGDYAPGGEHPAGRAGMNGRRAIRRQLAAASRGLFNTQKRPQGISREFATKSGIRSVLDTRVGDRGPAPT